MSGEGFRSKRLEGDIEIISHLWHLRTKLLTAEITFDEEEWDLDNSIVTLKSDWIVLRETHSQYTVSSIIVKLELPFTKQLLPFQYLSTVSIQLHDPSGLTGVSSVFARPK